MALVRKHAIVFIVALVALVVVFGAGLLAPRLFPSLAPFASESESTDSRIIESVSRKEQVVLLSLGIQGISEKNGKSTFLGVDVPGSTRASFLQ